MTGNENPGLLPDIRREAEFRAPIDRVWDAVATSEGIAAWFMPNTFRPELGYEFELNAGPFGQSPCKVTELDPPRRLSFAWAGNWTVTFELTDLGGRTRFVLTHSGWEAGKLTQFGEKNEVVRERMANGWVGIVGKLGALVEA